MGIGDLMKATFGKQGCAFCGREVGMMRRTKLKDKEYICNDCGYGCSRFIQKYRFTKDELHEHMKYMKRQAALYEKMEGKYSLVIPTATNKESIEFYDDFGMFRIRNMDADKKYAKELFRYDQVAKYEPYLEESEPNEEGKEKEFGECGVDITLLPMRGEIYSTQKQLRAHPYITETIRVCVNNRDKHTGQLEVKGIIHHFDYIFGVKDGNTALIQFGLNKQQRREGEAIKAAGAAVGAIIKATKTGEVSEDAIEKVTDAMNKVEDARTAGLARFSRLADEAEASI